MSERGGQRKADTCKPVLIGLGAFFRLRNVQVVLPQPRMDMRYLVEGSIELLSKEAEVLERWLQAARHELARELENHWPDGCAVVERGTGSPLGSGHRTGGHRATEGAGAAVHVRAHGASHAVNTETNGCKSLLLSAEAFQRLRAIQGTTRHPRLELRYLVDGAIALLHQDAASHAEWVRQSRQALATHLAQLQQLPVPNHMEIKT